MTTPHRHDDPVHFSLSGGKGLWICLTCEKVILKSPTLKLTAQERRTFIEFALNLRKRPAVRKKKISRKLPLRAKVVDYEHFRSLIVAIDRFIGLAAPVSELSKVNLSELINARAKFRGGDTTKACGKYRDDVKSLIAERDRLKKFVELVRDESSYGSHWQIKAYHALSEHHPSCRGVGKTSCQLDGGGTL